MPTSGEMATPYLPRSNIIFHEDQTAQPAPVVQNMTADQFVAFDCTPPASTVQSTNTNLVGLKEIKSATSISPFIKALIALAIAGAAATVIAVPVVLTRKAATTTISSVTVSSTTQTTATTTTETTTTATCASGYSQATSGGCYNLQIDFNNCGSFGYMCSSNYTSCSAGVCSGAPPVQLVGAVAISGWGGQFSVDDAYITITFPLNLTLYNYSSNAISITSNGVVCLGGCSAAYSNGNLPDGQFGGATAFGYWDDLMIYSGTSQTVYYNVDGTAPNRTTTFEFYESHFGAPTEYYHFQIVFHENLPNFVKYIYFQISDNGSSSTVGVQGSPSGPTLVYSVNQAGSVIDNTILTFDTNAGTFTG